MKIRYSVVLVILIFFTLMTQSLIASTNQSLSSTQYGDFTNWGSANSADGHISSSYSTHTQELNIVIGGEFYTNGINITGILVNITISTNTQHYIIGNNDFNSFTFSNITQSNGIVYILYANFSTIIHLGVIDSISVNADLNPTTSSDSLNSPEVLTGVSYRVYDIDVIQVIYFIMLTVLVIYTVAFFFIGDENDPEEGLHVSIALSQFIVLSLILLRAEPTSQRSSFVLYVFSIVVILLIGYELPPYIIANRAAHKIAKNKDQSILSVKNAEDHIEKKNIGDNSFFSYVESMIPKYGKENLFKITLKELVILFLALLLLVLFRYHEDTFPVLAIIYLGMHFLSIDPKSVV